jgi:Cu(I)/Ag(I) efflux system membrane protein CusA/SilA
MINSENAMLRGSVLFNVRDRDLGSTVEEAQDKLNTMMTKLPKGYYVEWSGQWENQIRAKKNTISDIAYRCSYHILILYFTYKSMKEALITMITVPFALIGGILWSILWD